MEKRIFVAIGVSIAFLWLWAAVAPKFFPELARPKTQPVTAASQKKAVPPTAPQAGTSTSPAAVAPATTTQAPATDARTTTPVGSEKVSISVVDTPEYVAQFSNRGAELISFRLKQYKAKDGSLVELVKGREPSRNDFPFAIEASNASVAARLNSALYSVSDGTDRGTRTIEFRYAAADGLSATKTFQVLPDYQFHFTVNVAPAIPYRISFGPGIRTLSPAEHDNRIIVTGNGVVQREGKLKVLSREKGDRIQIFPETDFIGIEDNYFLAVLRPERAGASTLRRVDIVGGPKRDVRKELYAGLAAAPDGTVSGKAFFGPKEATLMERVGLATTLQFGMFGIIARFLLEVLVWINRATKNYGFAIIVLTIIIKVVLYPLQHKSIVSMKKMQKVQPKMEAIKNRYKKARTDPEQRQKMNVEMMQLYKVEGINPMSGCLPMLLQLPILWGFYGLLSRAIELRGAPFMLWIQDLSEKDPYYITPILMTATMFIQTWITPSTGDPAQRRIFLIMPIVFGWIFKEFPSGLVIYWLVQNILTIAQQMIMNKWWKDHPAELQQ